jgi:acetyltransferase-like isoleucine patch superfamily enzyme
VIARSASVGDGTVVFAGAVVGARARIGANAVLYSGAIVEHDSIVESHAYLSPGVVLAGAVTIREGAFLGAGAVVLPGVEIGRDAVIAAGAVVTTSVGAAERVAGVKEPPGWRLPGLSAGCRGRATVVAGARGSSFSGTRRGTMSDGFCGVVGPVPGRRGTCTRSWGKASRTPSPSGGRSREKIATNASDYFESSTYAPPASARPPTPISTMVSVDMPPPLSAAGGASAGGASG